MQSLRRLTAWILMLCISLGCSERDAVVVLRLGHSLDQQHPVHQAMVHMQTRLASLSQGTMALLIYPGSQLGNERELIELLQIGSLAMTKVSASPLESFVPEMKLFNVPYLFQDRAHLERVLDGDIGQDLLRAPSKAGLRGLAYYDAGARSFYTTERPVRHPGDLDGLKIRVQESATAMNMVSALGGAPTPIAWGELYTALQQGVVDGAENNPPSFHLSGHYEVSKYFTLDEHTSVPDILLISEFVWQGLTETQRGWVIQAAQESAILQRTLWGEATEAALNAVAEAGVEIIYPDKKPFTAQVAAMQATYAKTALGPLMQHIAASAITEAGSP
jgi:tripartite ATP-independent transporter DctP family solute receptor